MLSPNATRMLREASEAIMRRRPDLAVNTLTGLLALAPRSAQARHLMGVAQRMLGEADRALETLHEAVALDPDNAGIQADLAITAFELGHFDTALSHMQRACELAPDKASIWFNQARMLHRRGAHADAREALLKALQCEPGHISAHMLLAEIATSRGDGTEAARRYREVLKRQPFDARAWLSLANLKTTRLDANDLSRLQKALARPSLDDATRASLGFALAKALEDTQQFEQAFDALDQANGVMSRKLRWNADAAEADIRAIAQAFASPAAADDSNRRGEEVIFIVSLPRAGSTLVEQMLASHPAVEGGGELLDLQQTLDEESQRRGKPFPAWVADAGADDWARLGRRYLERTAHLRTSHPRSTDKNLINWQFVGAIRAMLPGARIIVCTRDPLETCLSCYRQMFNTGNGFSYDLDHMARRWHDFDRTIRQWKSDYPGHIFELRHEALQEDPRGEVEALLAACGLEFDDACLTFHDNERVVRTASAAQVRQPLQRNTAVADRYGTRLDRLRQLLK